MWRSVYLSAEKGFTIVEVMIVIVIIAVLATLSVQFFKGSRPHVLTQEAVTYAQQVRGAVLRYIEDTGSFPSNKNVLDIDLSSQWDCGINGNINNFVITVVRVLNPCVKITIDQDGNLGSPVFGSCSL